MYLSIVIPMFNEQNRIRFCFYELLNYFKEKDFDWEIIFVDDGSVDKTINIIEENMRCHNNIRLIKHKDNFGKGAAIKTGIFEAGGDLILFSDVDLSVPIFEIEKLLLNINDCDIAIGSRMADSSLLLKKQPLHRVFIGYVARFLIKFILGLKCQDTQCGFKLFKKDVARFLFERMRTGRWSFDYEVLYIAKKNKMDIKEIPVLWANNLDSRVNSILDPIRSFIDLIKIRFYKY